MDGAAGGWRAVLNELSKKVLLKGSEPLAVMMSGGWGAEDTVSWEVFGARFVEVVAAAAGEAVGVEVTGTSDGLEIPSS